MAPKRTILITGCSDDSLGSALALAFHHAGWRVFASARNTAKLAKSKAAGIEILQLDTLSDESISKCASQIKDLTGGSLDTLLNNAGGGYSMPVIDINIAKAKELFDLNVWSVISVTRAFLPLLLESTHGGTVVNNTSLSSVIPANLPFSGAYNASKAALASLTDSLRLELEPFGIKVVNLVTGSVQSTFHHNAAVHSLPPDSIYNVAKETVEKAMAGSDTDNKGDREQYAKGVVKDISRAKPSHWVWRGNFTALMRIASLLPIGWMDSSLKSMTGLDVVKQKVDEQMQRTRRS